MAERITQQQSSDVSGIALELPATMTTGAVLAALHRAWKAGYSWGRANGFVEGQRQLAEVQDILCRAMAPTVQP